MTAAATASLLRPDGLRVLSGLRQTMQARFVALGPHPGAGNVRALLLLLEMRCKLEEQLLFPALYEALGRRVSQAEEREISTLREMAGKVSGTNAVDRPTLLVALEGLSLLHFDAVERLAATHADLVDTTVLGRQMAALLARWQGEVRQHGEIEDDEESDPVGQAPR